MKTIGVYVHIPFCNTFCSYCDFCKTKPDSFLMEKYIDSLCEEIEMFSLTLTKYTVDTIYIGGGTPSILPVELFKKLVSCIDRNFKLNLKEFTTEANPDSLDEDKIIAYKNCGVTRLSLGVQSMDASLLKSVGRKHSPSKVLSLLNILHNHKITTSVDLLLGIPNSNQVDIKQTLCILTDKVEHISIYALKVEENTPLYKLSQKNPELLPSDDFVANLYDFSYNYLKENSFKRYETSNFCKNSKLSKHNLKYWTMQDYIGFGVSSHSKINHFRFYNTNNIEKYIENIFLLKNNINLKNNFISIFENNINFQFNEQNNNIINFNNDLIANFNFNANSNFDNKNIDVSNGLSDCNNLSSFNTYNDSNISDISKVNFDKQKNIDVIIGSNNCNNLSSFNTYNDNNNIDNKNKYIINLNYKNSISTNEVSLITKIICIIETPLTSKEDVIFEELMLSLRLSKGININKFNKKYSISFIEKFKTAIEKNNSYTKFTKNHFYIKEEYFYLLNSILIDFME